jgi:hypothetical protein
MSVEQIGDPNDGTEQAAFTAFNFDIPDEPLRAFDGGRLPLRKHLKSLSDHARTLTTSRWNIIQLHFIFRTRSQVRAQIQLHRWPDARGGRPE